MSRRYPCGDKTCPYCRDAIINRQKAKEEADKEAIEEFKRELPKQEG